MFLNPLIHGHSNYLHLLNYHKWAFVNDFVWHAISFFLAIYEGEGLLGPEVALRYLLPLERLSDSFKKKKNKTLYHTLSLNFKIVVIFFVLGKTLRFSIKQWSILALCITKYLFCVSVMVLHDLPNSFSEDMSYCQRLLVFSINISNVILKYQKYFFLLFHSLTSLFWGRRFYFFIVFRPCPCTKIAFPLEREKSSMFRTKFIVTQIRWF